MIVMNAVTKVFGESARERPAVDALSIEVEPGTAAILAGPNGSGKTTTLALCAGMLRPTSGQGHRGQ